MSRLDDTIAYLEQRFEATRQVRSARQRREQPDEIAHRIMIPEDQFQDETRRLDTLRHARLDAEPRFKAEPEFDYYRSNLDDLRGAEALRVKVQGIGGATKWMNLTQDQAAHILAYLSETSN